MTEREARDLAKRIREGAHFAIRNHDGEWGVRHGDDGLVLFTRVPHGDDPPDEALTEEGLLDLLRPHAAARIRAALRPPA